MSENKISVLFMDDEPSSEIVQVAVEWMGDEGLDVELAESMSRAIQSYYDTFYDVFVLDIDMSHIADDEEGDGVNVLKRFVSLHNQTPVIMFSGAGTVPHWFAAANAHCYAYVHKNEDRSVQKLIRLIRESVKKDRRAPAGTSKKKCPKRILIFDGDQKYGNEIEDAVLAALGNDWDMDRAGSLADVEQALEDFEKYGIVILFQDVFEMVPEERKVMTGILSRGPAPEIIVGCLGKDEQQDAILFIANQHPFRMIDLDSGNRRGHLEEALKNASIWYGRPEIFEADDESLKRTHVTLPRDTLEEWEYTAGDMEDEYDISGDDEEWEE